MKTTPVCIVSRNWLLFLSFLGTLAVPVAGISQLSPAELTDIDRARVIEQAEKYLLMQPVTITASSSPRSAGGLHDFFSEGDYWWPDPKKPDGPYIQRDGQTNPENFVEHRKALMGFSVQAATLAAAYRISHEEKYAIQAIRHFKAWFVDPATRMNPHLRYAQAIKGKVTGRGTGIIDTIHLIEIAKAIEALEGSVSWTPTEIAEVKDWFRQYLIWMTTHQYGQDERDTKNNHATCWVFQVAAFAELLGDHATMTYCRERFKNVLLPNQMAPDGSFPLELKRTKPYGYSLFNLEAFAGICQILSTANDNLWTFTLPDGRGMKKGIEFMLPFIADKSKWAYPPDVMHFESWPMRQSSLLFAGNALNEPEYIKVWQNLNPQSPVDEVIRNFPIRQPILWMDAHINRPDVHLINALSVEEARNGYFQKIDSVRNDLRWLIRSADKALDAKPLSVVDKTDSPPSGDKHDYMSVAPYFWPDTTKPNGLPYIRRDGERNPDRATIGDRTRVGDLIEAVQALSLGYYVSRDEKYATQAAKLIHVWFLAPATRMNPNLKFAQAVRGVNEGRGTGIIDTYKFADLVESMTLISASPSWPRKDQDSVKAWFNEYLNWLRESTNGQKEAFAPNNHGTTYAVQECAIALFVGRDSIARSILDTIALGRIAKQIEPDGSEPLELVRTKSWGYSILNLEGLMRLALLGEHFGMDLWRFKTTDGRSIRQCIDWLTPYAIGEKEWTYKQIVPMEKEKMYPILRIASEKYHDANYTVAAGKIPGIEKLLSRGRIVATMLR